MFARTLRFLTLVTSLASLAAAAADANTLSPGLPPAPNARDTATPPSGWPKRRSTALNRSFPNSLDDFGTLTLTGGYAADDAGNSYSPGMPGAATANIDWMTWNGVPLSQDGTLFACGTVSGPAAVRFSRASYKIVAPGQQGQLEPKPQRCRP